MIRQAKRNFAKGGSFYFLLWGWVVMLANIGHYLLSKYELFERPYIVWLITIPAGIASGIYGARQGKNAKVRSHFDRLYGLMWIAVALMTLIFFIGNVNTNLNAIILLFAGLGTLNSGFMLRFKPLILGGLALWIANIIAFTLPVTDQYLVGAVGIFAGYLIPGYLLKKVENV